MKEIAAAMPAMTKQQIAQIERNGKYMLSLPLGDVVLTTEDVEIFTEDMPGWLVANEGRLTVALDITVTEALKREGIARELVNRIQNIRKASGYEITDKISVEVEENPEVNDAIKEYADYIQTQTLANSILLQPTLKEKTSLDFDDYVVNVCIRRV